MAAFFGNKLVLPIGCSCIGQFQLQGSKRLPAFRESGFVFDWAIATPDSTVEVLDRRAPFVASADDLELVNGRVRSKAVPGVYFWHIKDFLQLRESDIIASLADHPSGVRLFLEQHRHVMGKLDGDVEEMLCLWSNIQPNLQWAAREVGVPWSDFLLTPGRYAAIKEGCARLRARKVAVWFVCRREDVHASLAGLDDVTILEVPRSDTDFKGAPGLFDPVFERMGLCGDAGAAR